MNVLYAGAYRRRFRDVCSLIEQEARSVCELCFGDTLVAEWCRSRGIKWTGVDLNPRFCARARAQGFDVIEGDLLALSPPRADVFIMVGSLYHFHERLSELFDLVWSRTGTVVLSEPVRNLSSQPGPIGWWARRSANPGNREAGFRYTEDSLREALDAQRKRHTFDIRPISVQRDMLMLLHRPSTSD